jgi:hypothetical protein
MAKDFGFLPGVSCRSALPILRPVQTTTRNQGIVRTALLQAVAGEDEDLVCLVRVITAQT